MSRSGVSGAAQRLPLALLLTCAVFLAVLLYLLASSLSRRSAPTFAPSRTGEVLGDPGAGVTVTVEARDESLWRYLDLDAATLLDRDSTGWDLAIRRFRIRAAGPVERLAVGPSAASGPSQGAAADFGKWYRYGMLSHLLEPSGDRYEVRTDRGASATIEILSYYCEGLEAGCLTLRYRVHDPRPAAR